MGQGDDKTNVPPLDENSDYLLWCVRMDAFCDAKEIGHAQTRRLNPHAEGTEDYKVFELNRKKASNLIFRSPTNRVMRIVLPERGSPHRILKKLDERYVSKSTVKKDIHDNRAIIKEILINKEGHEPPY